jgi:hypothetical protein
MEEVRKYNVVIEGYLNITKTGEIWGEGVQLDPLVDFI